MRKRLVFLGLALLVVACTVSPTGRQQFLMMSPRQLDEMGAQAFQEIKGSKETETSRRANKYVQCVSNALLAEMRSGPSRWEIKVFREDAVNAFALPGGKIGVNTGLLAVAVNQDQLAAVIGHEIGHVLANHANERMSQEVLVQGGLAAVGSLGGGSAGVSPGAMQALGLGAQVGILLPFSRVHESEADAIGLDLMARAGFDPRESVKLWQNMARASGGQPPEFLSTHPSHGSRIRNLRAKMGPALQTYEAARGLGKKPRCGQLSK